MRVGQFVHLISISMSAVAKAAPNYMPLAKQANTIAFQYPGAGFPYGPYVKGKEKVAPQEKVAPID